MYSDNLSDSDDAELSKLSSLYLGNSRNWPWHIALSYLKDYENQKRLFDKTIGHPLSVRYPPAGNFLNNFIKTWINKVGDGEVLEDVFDKMGELLSKPVTNKGYRIYSFDNWNTFVVTHETISMCSKGTTGLQSWQACFVGCSWAAQNKAIFSGKRVVELGCGVGLLGASLAPLSSHVTMTDHHTSVLESAKKTVEVNKLSNVNVMEVDWRHPVSLDDFDIVVAADVVFDPALLPDLCKTIKLLLKRPDNACFLFSTVRNSATYECLLQCLSSSKLKFETLEMSSVNHYLVASVKDVKLLKITTS